MHEHVNPWRPEGVRAQGTGVTDGCRLSSEFWEPTLVL